MRVAMTGGRTVVTAVAVALAASALAAGTAGAHSGRAPAASGGYSSADLDRDLAAVRTAGGGDVNVVARVDRAGQGALRARHGTAGIGSKAPVPWNPEFRTASTTKTFTAVVVLQLVAEHELSLDDTVEHWLPGVVSGHGNDGSRITVRDLLQQTSGLFDYITDPDVQDKLLNHFDENRYDVTPPEQLVAIAMAHPPLFTPGAGKWAYSNTNYLLAAMIAQKASGQDWQQLVEHKVIAPLGLRDTYIPGANPFLVGPHEQVTITGPDGKPLDLTEHELPAHRRLRRGQHPGRPEHLLPRPGAGEVAARRAVGRRCGRRCPTTTCRCPPRAGRAATGSGCGSCR